MRSPQHRSMENYPMFVFSRGRCKDQTAKTIPPLYNPGNSNAKTDYSEDENEDDIESEEFVLL